MPNYEALPAGQIADGGLFKKLTGSCVYRRLSESSAKFLGLDPKSVYGMRDNGNIMVVGASTLVHAVSNEEISPRGAKGEAGVNGVDGEAGGPVGKVGDPLWTEMEEVGFEAFTRAWSKEELKEAADRNVFTVGHPFEVFRSNGGPVASVIRGKLSDFRVLHVNVEKLTERLLDHYKLRDYYPRVSLVREALALVTQLKLVIEKIHPDFQGVLDGLVEASDSFEAVDRVYVAPFEKVKEIADIITKE
jgi:hypothetical protein